MVRTALELNAIYNEDCLKTMARMPDAFVDLTVTSPPYDGQRDYDGYSFDFEKIAEELFRVTKRGGVVVWVVDDATVDGSESGTSFRQALYFKDQCGFNLHDTMIYLKSSFSRPSSNRCHQVFEYMFVFSKGSPQTFHQILDRRTLSDRSGKASIRQKDGSLVKGKARVHPAEGGRFNVWRYVTGKGHSTRDEIAYEHPAIFPELLAEDHIVTWSNEGDLVYDPFMGSGTTAKMALKNGRKFVGSEISAKYCDIAKKRLDQWKNQKRINGWFK